METGIPRQSVKVDEDELSSNLDFVFQSPVNKYRLSMGFCRDFILRTAECLLLLTNPFLVNPRKLILTDETTSFFGEQIGAS